MRVSSLACSGDFQVYTTSSVSSLACSGDFRVYTTSSVRDTYVPLDLGEVLVCPASFQAGLYIGVQNKHQIEGKSCSKDRITDRIQQNGDR